MPHLTFAPPPVAAQYTGNMVRFDTAESTDTPADIAPLDGGRSIDGSVLRSDPSTGSLPKFRGPDNVAILWRKILNYAGTVVDTARINGASVAAASTGTADGSVEPEDLSDDTLSYLTDMFVQLSEPVTTVAASGSTQTLPAAPTATVHALTLTANCTFTFPTPVTGRSFTAALTQESPSTPPGWQSTNTSTEGGATSKSVNVPSGAASGDVMLYQLFMLNGTSTTPTGPSGFTLRGVVDSAKPYRTWVWYKQLSAADTGTYDVSWTGAQYSVAHCSRFTGARAAGDPFDQFTYAANAAVATATPSLSLTTTQLQTLGLFIGNGSPSGGVFGTPAGWTRVFNGSNFTTIFTKTLATAGATGSVSATASSEYHSAFLGALLPSWTPKTVTWPGTVRWPSGVAPTLSLRGGTTDYITFLCTDGTHWDGFLSGLDLR